MNLERAAMLAMGLGLLLVIQPWIHALFAVGFLLALAGVVAHNVAAFLRKSKEGKG